MSQSTSMTKLFLFLFFGLIGISFASVLIKLCAAPALTIAFYRLFIATIFYTLLAKLKRPTLETRPLKSKMLLSGLFLALHFITWITSLQYTSVISSVVLVQSSPLFTAIASALILKELPARKTMIGLGFGIIGMVGMALIDLNQTGSNLMGNGLALAGAIFAAAYLTIGRSIRAHMDTINYVKWVYGSAAGCVFVTSLFTSTSLTGFTPHTWLILMAIAIGPQIVGHTSLNYALKHLTAVTVSLFTLAEPLGASLLAFFLLGERPSLLKIVFGVIILYGIALAILGEKRNIEQ
ncbi:EamA family transporter [candidate division KSB1 bacterium]|nr:EamA family transporter [candidate division KSB1 bacterium]